MQILSLRSNLMCSGTILLALSAAAPAPTQAAVRQCHAIVSSEIATAAAEHDARKKALEQWRAKAHALGPGFDSWRLAHSKSLKCFRKDAAFECVAFGAPCIIDQTPKSPPLLPGKKDVGI